jgi:SAM-dependent methyltransferase
LNPGQFDNDVDDDFQTPMAIVCLSSLNESTVMEIGCGMGRLPCSQQCKTYVGVDISEKMISACDAYLKTKSRTNCRLVHNNGLKLPTDTTFDFVFSTGVFQHIVYFDVIVDYIKQALELLTDNGIFLFQFLAFLTEKVGRRTIGAMVTAKRLNESLRDDTSVQYSIREMSIDRKDPNKQIIIILQKANDGERDFEKAPLIDKDFRTGTADGLATYKKAKVLWKRNQEKEICRLTFCDD